MSNRSDHADREGCTEGLHWMSGTSGPWTGQMRLVGGLLASMKKVQHSVSAVLRTRIETPIRPPTKDGTV